MPPKLRVYRRERARRDLVESFVLLAEQGDVALAERFLEAVEKTLDQLADMPRLGTQRRFGAIGDVRIWQVTDFKRHLVVYRTAERTLEVLRILEGNQDLEKLLS